MDCPEDIERLANERIEEAKILFSSGKYDGAYYLAGYSIELILKAKICKTFGVPNLFCNDEKKIQDIAGINEVRKAVKTHNLLTLLIYSGLKEKFDQEKASQKALSLGSSKFFQGWSENLRYNPCGTTSENDCKDLLNIIQDILKWIQKN